MNKVTSIRILGHWQRIGKKKELESSTISAFHLIIKVGKGSDDNASTS